MTVSKAKRFGRTSSIARGAPSAVTSHPTAPRMTVVGDEILIHQRTLPEAKSLGARWSASDEAWKVQATRSNALSIVDADPDLGDLSGALLRSYDPLEDSRLYDYQRETAGRLVAAPHGQLVVLSPGLGKTAVSVVAADASVPPEEKVIVIAPASLLNTWGREIRKWQTMPGEVYIVRGKWDMDSADAARWIVMSWEKASLDHDIWSARRRPLWILDESVLMKSKGSKRFKTMRKIRRQAERVWLLSGNPTTRHADDLWSQLHLIWPKAFNSYWRFAERYCIVEETPWARVVSGTRKTRDVMDENSDLVIVVNQEDVLDLPEYLFEVIDVQLTPKQRKEYDRMSKAFIAELEGEEVVAQNEVGKLMKLQQITSWWETSAKHDALLDLIPSYEGPHLIWTHWRTGADALTNRLADALESVAHIDGSTSARAKDEILEEYKAGRIDALVLSIGVGKFGHTFTNVKTVHWIDKTYSADDYFQAMRRVRRIGLTHRPVSVTYRAPGTVDELVEMNLEGKLGSISKLTRSRLGELLNGLGKEIPQ